MKITHSQWATIAMIAIAAFIFSSCNPYKEITKTPPLTHADSLRLAYRCEITYPVDTTSKTRIEYIKGVDSSEIIARIVAQFKGRKDSVLNTIIEKYKDTCRGAVNDATDACNACYEQGLAEGKQKGYVRIDTAKYTETITRIDQRLIMLANERVTVAETKAAKYNLQADRRKNTIFILGGLLLLFLIGGFFIIKNNLKNIIR